MGKAGAAFAADKPLAGQSLNLLIIQSHAVTGKKLAEDFEAATGAKVNVTIVPYDQVGAKATLDVQSGVNEFDELIDDIYHFSEKQGLEIDMMSTSFFLGRATLVPKIGSEMAYWREKLFVAMFRNASSATTFYKIPSNRVVELGTQVVL